ncbi:MAG: FYDLN acid domain-containing protein [Methylocystaceae bacterium]|nr:FYDLN acid domain-containing protein [Methylocystaceae bacterium]
MKPEWGQKHECSSCGAHFYDMRKPEACCPKCQTPVNDEATLLAKTKQAIQDVPPPKKEKDDPLDDFDDFDDMDDDMALDDDEDDFIEDADDLVGDDDSDMSEIMEHMDESVVDQNL